jgi:hypothetical protein
MSLCWLGCIPCSLSALYSHEDCRPICNQACRSMSMCLDAFVVHTGPTTVATIDELSRRLTNAVRNSSVLAILPGVNYRSEKRLCLSSTNESFILLPLEILAAQ